MIKTAESTDTACGWLSGTPTRASVTATSQSGTWTVIVGGGGGGIGRSKRREVDMVDAARERAVFPLVEEDVCAKVCTGVGFGRFGTSARLVPSLLDFAFVVLVAS